MVKLRCMTLDGGALQSNRYKGISGQTYLFHKGIGTDVKNREDAEYFLNSGGGKVFKKYGTAGKLIDDAKKALAEVAKELPLKKKEKVPEEIPIEEQDKSKPELKSGESVEKKLYTASQIKAESKRWQINKIKELGGTNIPGLEEGRIKLILKLQRGG